MCLLFYFVVILCPDPGPIGDATRQGSRFQYGDNVTYTCDPGFTRTSGQNGNIVITCGADFKWTGWDQCSCE